MRAKVVDAAATLGKVGEDLTLSPIKGPPTAKLEAAQAYARASGARRLPDVYRYLAEVWRLAVKVGYDPAVLAAQSAQETDRWRSPAWEEKLNPAGIGADDGKPEEKWPGWATPEQAARAQIVHMSAYVGGYVNALRPYIELDPKWQAVFETGGVYRVKTLRDLAGRWATDIYYAEKIADHLRAMRAQIVTPPVTPPAAGAAPLPAGIIQHPTGNWHERYPGAAPQLIVYHITDDLVLGNTISWFQNPASGASSHVVIDRDGSIHQFVSSTKAAWTNGDVDNPRTDIVFLAWLIGRARGWPAPHTVNDYSLTIEHVGKPSVPPTEAQYLSSIAISAYWRDRYKIRPSRAQMIRHADINSVNRLYCPGPDFDLARIIRALGGNPEDLTG